MACEIMIIPTSSLVFSLLFIFNLIVGRGKKRDRVKSVKKKKMKAL